ncbi:acyl-CoA dehydrogenase family protein [Chloroflexota bacterium]
MDFGITKEQEQLRQEVRAFVEKEVTPEVVRETELADGLGQASWEFLRKAGARGWLTPAWPREYGGLDGTHTDKLIIVEEFARHAAPDILVGSGMAGPTILLFGSDEQKKEFLPRIASGEIEFALGYTEPHAGSDLASLEIRAVEDGDYYVINGQKMFNTACHFAQYHWLGARTDPDAPKHQGVSLFIVDMKSPGITVRPLWTLADWRTNEVYYDDVRVPKKNLVGQKNRGFYHIATALDFERIFPIGGMQRNFEKVMAYARETKREGQILSKDPVFRQKAAEIALELNIARLLSYRVAWIQDTGTVPNYESSMLKMFATELWQRMYEVAMETTGLYGQLKAGSKWAPLDGKLEHFYRFGPIETVVAGSSEIMRGVIAMRGLGLPR